MRHLILLILGLTLVGCGGSGSGGNGGVTPPSIAGSLVKCEINAVPWQSAEVTASVTDGILHVNAIGTPNIGWNVPVATRQTRLNGGESAWVESGSAKSFPVDGIVEVDSWDSKRAKGVFVWITSDYAYRVHYGSFDVEVK